MIQKMLRSQPTPSKQGLDAKQKIGRVGSLGRSLLLLLLFAVAFLAGCGNDDPAPYNYDQNSNPNPQSNPPLVSSTVPTNGSTGVPLNQAVLVSFSSNINPATLTGSSVTLQGPGVTPVAGTVTGAGQTATFVPTGGLLANTLYTGTISTAVQDTAGRSLANSFIWSFTTGAAPDTQAPSVTSSNPANGATAVATNQKVLVTFTEAMNPSSLSNASFKLTAPGSVAVSGIVSYVGRTATFVPSTPLANSTRYSGTVTTAATDLAGNPLAANFSWAFTTGAVADTSIPTVTSTLPANAAIGIGINSQITANFSEGMDPATLSTVTFIVAGPGNSPIAGTVTYVGLTATFSPNAPLSNSTVYTGLITRGAKDLAGNALAANYTWTFTTGAAPDTTAPTVTSNVPAVNAVSVAINQKIICQSAH